MSDSRVAAKAASTVWNRLQECCGEVTPQVIASTSAEAIQKCGLSMRKACYIKNIGDAVVSKELDIADLHTLPDEEIIRRLSGLHGVGVWTAEMLLIFSLERPNILSWGDLAIRRGMMSLLRLEKT